MTRRARALLAGFTGAGVVLAASSAIAQAAPPALPAAATPAPAGAVVQPPAPVQLELKGPVNVSMPAAKGWPPWVGTAIGSLASGLLGLGGVWLGLRLNRNTAMATIHQKANEAELAKIEALLGGFHLRYLQLAEENRLVYDEFANALEGRHPTLQNFSLLTSLLQPEWLPSLSKNDQTLIRQIIDNGTALQTLIRDKSGGVSLVLMEFLVRAAVHYSTLKLVYEGALSYAPTRMATFVYPRALDDAIKADVKRLRARADKLRAAPDQAHGPIDELVAPEKLADWPPRKQRSGRPEAAPVETHATAKAELKAQPGAQAGAKPTAAKRAKAVQASAGTRAGTMTPKA